MSYLVAFLTKVISPSPTAVGVIVKVLPLILALTLLLDSIL